MADKVDADTRSKIMSKVKSSNTSLEIAVRKALHREGFRFRLYRSDLPGKPDLVFPQYRLALFVHGCFWHNHGCKRSRLPTTNNAYWSAKIQRNAMRDAQNVERLQSLGWDCCVIWECELSKGINNAITELKHRRDARNIDQHA
jgi:DNA mismatch endonuclease (patch repair protein)